MPIEIYFGQRNLPTLRSWITTFFQFVASVTKSRSFNIDHLVG